MHARPRDACAAGQFEHREDVRLVAVHAAGRQQAHHVQRAAAGLRGGAGGAQLGVGEEAAVLDRRVDRGSGPGRRCGRRRGSCGRLRNCPSARRAGRRGGLRYGSACAARWPSRRRQFGRSAWARALSVGSSRWPQPSRISRTTGLGRGGLARGIPQGGRPVTSDRAGLAGAIVAKRLKPKPPFDASSCIGHPVPSARTDHERTPASPSPSRSPSLALAAPFAQRHAGHRQGQRQHHRARPARPTATSSTVNGSISIESSAQRRRRRNRQRQHHRRRRHPRRSLSTVNGSIRVGDAGAVSTAASKPSTAASSSTAAATSAAASRP